MSDSLILAAASSPLISTLESDSSIQDFVYSLQSSVPIISRQRVSKSFTSPAFGATKSVSLNRYGVVYGMYLKIVVTANNADNDATKNAFINMVEEVTLSSHNRNLEVLTNTCNLHRIFSKPQSAREQILAVAQANGGLESFTGGLTVYVPLNFSFFNSMSTACLLYTSDAADE